MNKRFTAVAVAGTIGLGAVGAVAVAIPALADNSTPSPSATGAPATPPKDPQNQQQRQDQRETAIKDQLKSLVDDGTLTQAQADKVAEKLAAAGPRELRGFGGPGGPGPGRGPHGMGVDLQKLEETAATAVGLSADELRTQLRSGSTLADIAKKQGKNVDTVVNTLVQAARQQLAAAVKAKTLTQDQANQIDKNLKTAIQGFVQNGRMALGFRGGPGGGGERGWFHFQGPGRPDGTAPATPPSGAPTPSESGTSQSSSFSSI